MTSLNSQRNAISEDSTLITAQVPVSEWHAVVDEPTIADAILDRIVHQRPPYYL